MESKNGLEGGNGATIGSGITHSPSGEQNVGAREISRGDAEDVREGLKTRRATGVNPWA